MTSKQFRCALAKVGFNQTSYAKALNIDPRTVRAWIAGKWPVPVVHGVLLKLMLDTNTNAKDLK
jgi:hypothetical protein